MTGVDALTLADGGAVGAPPPPPPRLCCRARRPSQGGMEPYEILRSATRNAAESLGLGSDLGDAPLGIIAVGAIADLVVWPKDKSPLVNIFNTQELSHIVLDGRLFEVRSMAFILARCHPGALEPCANYLLRLAGAADEYRLHLWGARMHWLSPGGLHGTTVP